MANQYSKQIEDVLKREVSRAEFIKYVGLAFVAMLGVTTFLKNLSKNLGVNSNSSRKSNGYGSSPYGL